MHEQILAMAQQAAYEQYQQARLRGVSEPEAALLLQRSFHSLISEYNSHRQVRQNLLYNFVGGTASDPLYRCQAVSYFVVLT